MLRRKQEKKSSIARSAMNNIEMVIDSIRVSQMNYQRVVILREKEGKRYLPIWIGPAEADTIAVKMQNVSLSRPLTHDLLCKVIETYGGRVTNAIINELRKDTFYAKLVLSHENEYHEVDCRPSDALAVAVRAGATIFVDKSVLDQAGVLLDEEGKPSEQQAIVGQPAGESSKLAVFSEPAQQVLNLSEENAKRVGHDYINTRELLLALSCLDESTAAKILTNLGAGQKKIQAAIKSIIKEGQRQESDDGGLSVNVKKTISLATDEAKGLKSDHVCTEHLLLGLVQEGEGVAAAALQSLSVSREKILVELVRILNEGLYRQA